MINEYKDFINIPGERQRLGQTPGMHLEKQEDLWSRKGRERRETPNGETSEKEHKGKENDSFCFWS